MRISAVIPVFEDRKMLRERLPRGFHEIIVVDASRKDPVRKEDLPAGSVLIRVEACKQIDRAFAFQPLPGIDRPLPVSRASCLKLHHE